MKKQLILLCLQWQGPGEVVGSLVFGGVLDKMGLYKTVYLNLVLVIASYGLLIGYAVYY